MSTVAQKLGLTARSRVCVDGIPLDTARELLGELPDDVTLAPRGDDEADQIILAATGLSDLAGMLPGVWSGIAPGGRLWVWYRKGASRGTAQGAATPLHRDTLQALLAAHGMNGVTLIAVDEAWSAMRVKRT
jgi:hypothetical protein